MRWTSALSKLSAYVFFTVWSICSTHRLYLPPRSESHVPHLIQLLTAASEAHDAETRPLSPLIVLGPSPADLYPFRAATPRPLFIGTEPRRLGAALTPGPTYGPRAGAASVVLLLLDDEGQSAGGVEEVIRLVEELRMSSLWAAYSKLLVVVYNSTKLTGELSSSLAPIQNSTVVWKWNNVSFQRVMMNYSYDPKELQYMGWPCIETVNHPPGNKVLDTGNARTAQELMRRVPELRGTRCVEGTWSGVGTRLPNGSFTGHLADMENGLTVMLFQNLLFVPSWEPIAEYAYPHENDKPCIEVGRTPPLSFMELVINIFSKEIYALTFISILLSTFLNYLATGFCKNSSSFVSMILETLKCWFTGAFPVRKMRFPYVWVILSLCGLVFVSLLVGNMASRLTVVEYHREVNTLKELMKVVDKIALLSYYVPTFCSKTYPEIGNEMNKKCKPMLSGGEFPITRDKIFRGDKIGLVSMGSFADTMARLPKYQLNRRSAIRKVPQCLYDIAYVSFVLRKDSPYSLKINKVIQEIVQTGLRQKFSREGKDIYVIKNGGTFQDIRDKTVYTRTLLVSDLYEVFLFWLIALVLSFLVFVTELLK